MANVTALFSLLVVLILLFVGGQIVAEQLRDDHLGNYYFLWRNDTNNIFLNESGAHNMSLQRISTTFNANLTVAFEGGNESDNVSVNDYDVGNLSGASPKTIVVNAAYLAVDTVVNYTFANNTKTNVTSTALRYYSWDGCDYDIDTCESLDSSFTLTGLVFMIPPFLIFFFMVIIIVSALGGLARG